MIEPNNASNTRKTAQKPPRISIPRDVQTPVYFIDESGSKGSGGQFFVMAAVKTTDPDYLTRGMMTIRQRAGVHSELKFRNVTKGSLDLMKQFVELLHASGASLGAFVIDKSIFDPLQDKELWRGHAWTTSRLIKGMTTRRELATLIHDGISTPKNVAYGTFVKKTINDGYRTTRVISAISLDSRTSDGLQLADLVASAIAFERKMVRTRGAEAFLQANSPKAQLARYLSRTFDLPSFDDIKTQRVNIKTVYPPKGVAHVRQNGHNGHTAEP